MMPLVELRCEHDHLAAKLDVGRRAIQVKCNICSYTNRAPVFHWFDAETGELVEPEHEEARPSYAPKGVSEGPGAG